MRTGGDDEQECSSDAAAFYCASLVADAQPPHSAAVIDAVSGEPSDEALMLAYRDGDGAAFRLLYSPWYILLDLLQSVLRMVVWVACTVLVFLIPGFADDLHADG